MDTTTLARDVIKEAHKRGCALAEVFIKEGKKLSVEAKDGKVEALEAAEDFGMAIRVIKNGSLGFSFTTKSPVPAAPDLLMGKGAEEFREVIEKAIEGTKWTSTDEYNDIPQYRPPSDVAVLDSEIENISEEDAIKKALLLEEGALNLDERIKKVRKAVAIFTVTQTTIHNSRGIEISYKSTLTTAHVMALAIEAQDSQTGWDFAISRRLADIDFARVGVNAGEKAIVLLSARKIAPLKGSVVLDPSTAFQFLGILSASLSAEAVQKGKSMLRDKVGKTIISPAINVIDDGLIPWGAGTKPVDDEGVSTSRKTLISEGMLTGFIHNTYTARKDGVMSTGNAMRDSFKSLPGIDVTNLFIEPDETQESMVKGQESKINNKLIRSVSKGILVTDVMGVHTANPISGDFSVGISGLWIENGETVYPVKEAIISGNILELFKNVEGVGGDLRFYGLLGSPSLLIGGVDISA